ncbi:MAG: hypothetical protein MK212_07545 [Saprospiraceae bacterium]|nr:hypothetical protein [Saprospiraceae bacterium]
MQKISKKDINKAVDQFIKHRLWYRILQAYNIKPQWTTSELRDYLNVPSTKNILSVCHSTLYNLGYSLTKVDKNRNKTKYYLKKHNTNV